MEESDDGGTTTLSSPHSSPSLLPSQDKLPRRRSNTTGAKLTTRPSLLTKDNVSSSPLLLPPPTSTVAATTTATTTITTATSNIKGVWRAYLDTQTKRIFWVDQSTGHASWYVHALNPNDLPTGSFTEAMKKEKEKDQNNERKNERNERNERNDDDDDDNISQHRDSSFRSNTEESTMSLQTNISDMSDVLSDDTTDDDTAAPRSLSLQRLRSPSKLRKEQSVVAAATGLQQTGGAATGGAATGGGATGGGDTTRVTTALAPPLTTSVSAGAASGAGGGGGLSHHVSPSSFSSSSQPQTAASSTSLQLKNALIAGTEMNKHRARGAQKRRFISFSSNLDRIMWSKSRRCKSCCSDLYDCFCVSTIKFIYTSQSHTYSILFFFMDSSCSLFLFFFIENTENTQYIYKGMYLEKFWYEIWWKSVVVLKEKNFVRL